MNKKIFLSISLLALIGIVFFNLRNAEKYELNEDDKEVLKYFKEIALKSEYGNDYEGVTVWTSPMKLYIYSCGTNEEQVSFISDAIDRIDKLTGDTFRLELVEDIKQSNSIIYLCDYARTKQLEPGLLEGTGEDISGISSIWYDNFKIYKASIFVSTDESLVYQKSTILENITHCIGLMNCSIKYPESIFYEYQDSDETVNLDYTAMDSILVQLIYDPQMKPGTREWGVDNVYKWRKGRKQ